MALFLKTGRLCSCLPDPELERMIKKHYVHVSYYIGTVLSAEDCKRVKVQYVYIHTDAYNTSYCCVIRSSIFGDVRTGGQKPRTKHLGFYELVFTIKVKIFEKYFIVPDGFLEGLAGTFGGKTRAPPVHSRTITTVLCFIILEISCAL